MKRKPLIGLGAVVVVGAIAAAIVLGTRKPPADSHIARGKEFLSVQEFSAASSEFKIALKKHPESEEAKALLLYTTARSEDGASSLFVIYPVLATLADEGKRKNLAPDFLKNLTEAARNCVQDSTTKAWIPATWRSWSR